MGSLAETPQETLLAWVEGILIEKAHREAYEQMEHDGLAPPEVPWPSGHCVETSIELRDILAERWPEFGAAFVYGTFDLCGRLYDHAWVELANESIIDITGTQFFPGQAADSTLFWLPVDRMTERYSELERDPSWAQ